MSSCYYFSSTKLLQLKYGFIVNTYSFVLNTINSVVLFCSERSDYIPLCDEHTHRVFFLMNSFTSEFMPIGRLVMTIFLFVWDVTGLILWTIPVCFSTVYQSTVKA